MQIDIRKFYMCNYIVSYRESAEQRVKELQYLLNETFKRFSLNYDEDGDELSDEVSEL